MANRQSPRRIITSLIDSQLFCVLSTQQDGQPYASLVGFVARAELREIVFATGRSTTKFKSIEKDNRVALLIDNRSNQSSDLQQAAAATVIGRAVELHGPERKEAAELYGARHPSLRKFIGDVDTALLKTVVSSYILVSRFQEVVVWDPRLDFAPASLQ